MSKTVNRFALFMWRGARIWKSFMGFFGMSFLNLMDRKNLINDV